MTSPVDPGAAAGVPVAEGDAWARVGALRPRLPAHARIFRHQYRGQTWYVMQDRTSARCWRFDATAQRFIRAMDGQRSVEAIWSQLNDRAGAEVLTRDEVVTLLGQLHAAGALRIDAAPDVDAMFSRKERERRQQWKQRLARPLVMRFSLYDPGRLLDRLLPVVRVLFGPAGLMLWVGVVALAAMLCTSAWPGLMEHWAARGLDPRNLLLLAALYPLVKLLHELGHAFATRVWGGEVHEMGIMLLVLMPLPYVDASAAHTFPDKRRRMAVGAAGILVEVFLAALAMLVWWSVQPGIVRDIAFNVMLIGGVSTVLFNGNPLLRFDGYYVLADAIEIPNLGPRSSRYLGYLARRYLFGLRDAVSPVTAPGERAWFVVYGLASAAYRLVIVFTIALYVAGRFFVVGTVLAVWALVGQLLYPSGRYLAAVLFAPGFRGARVRAVAVMTLAVVGVGAVAYRAPVPSWTRAEGVVSVPEHALVRATGEGFLRGFMSQAGTPVSAGDPLFQLDDPELRTEVKVLEWRLRELESRRAAEFMSDRVQAEILADEIAAAEAELAEARERLARLTIVSPVSGTFVVSRADDLPGRFVRQGELLGFVIDRSAATARVVVPQDAVDRVRRRTEAVEVRLASRPGETVRGLILRELPSATVELPSRALGTSGGGAIAVDARDTGGTRAIDSVFQFDIALPPDAGRGYVGSRVYVRFRHGSTTLASEWRRSLRQLFLGRFQI